MKILFFFILPLHLQAATMMNHMPDGEKCIICHRADTPYKLLLRDGTQIPKEKVDILCGQCHGIKHRNWLNGMHGKVVQSWREGSLKRLTCTECHDPHAPKFPQFQSKNPPQLRGVHQ